MDDKLQLPVLHVEGTDDQHSVRHLLQAHGVTLESAQQKQPPLPKGAGTVGSVANKGVTDLLKAIETSVKTSGGRPVGFVLDADSPLLDRWNAVCAKLRDVDVEPPELPPAEGFIGESVEFKTRVGVWLMPDNQHDGTLEDFLQMLIDDKDILIGHAKQSTKKAKEIGAKFKVVDELKAVIHAWLAWQERPGCPYGTAIRARYFKPDSEAALAFVAWFKKLYSITA